MSRYKKGKRITSVGELEKAVEDGHQLFIIGWGSDGMVRHIGFIGAWQYHFLKYNIINGKGLWIAELKLEGDKE